MTGEKHSLKNSEVVADFYLAHLSRQVAILGKKEVLSGKAKFGIFGDGKEVAQIALAKNFRNGDWRSGYYRDHTFMMAAGLFTAEQFFYQLYGFTDEKLNPGSAGRSFNNHFATLSLNEDGSWNDLTAMKNTSADLSPTAGQMPRLVGLGYASKLFRQNKDLAGYNRLSKGGDEVAFGMIGDASTAEGLFFETINAVAVLQVPVAVSVWDDGYGISVTKDKQIVKSSISEALEGFKRGKDAKGIEIFTARGWDYPAPILEERNELLSIINYRSCTCQQEEVDKLGILSKDLQRIMHPIRKDIQSTAKRIMRNLCATCPVRSELQESISGWLEKYKEENHARYSAKLYNETDRSAMRVSPVPVAYGEESPMVNGREIIRDNFDAIFEKNPLVVTFGEDTGKIGDVNKGLEGLQDKYGELRVTDTGIRETTIIGQGVGMALRGLRPIAEIQYFDYLLYALQTLSDDLASLHWRTKGAQAAPVIIRTRGHRLEGIWHSGSPLSMVINSIRGIYVCVPRNMTQAAGMYNTLLEADDPALVIEPLKGYGLKEKRPENFGEFRVPLGRPEILNEGNDLTLVTYGSCVRIAETAVQQLKEFDINVELIDVQTLLPFDIDRMIGESVKKTNKVVFFDEDVPGGATAFMLQKVLEEQKVYYHLDAEPKTLSAHEHRPAYSSDGDYYSNPNAEDVFETVYGMMHESDPAKYPRIY